MAAQSRNIAELENASVWRLLIQYSLPSIAGMVVYSLYNIIDSVFIGHGVGPLALSGLAVTFPIMNLTFALGTLVGSGGAAISSIRLGRKDQEGTERTLGNVLIMSLIAAVVLVIPTLLFLTEILTAFGASGQTLTYAYDFMLITLLGLPVTYVFFNLNHVMRATGYPKKAMGSTLLSVGINIILAPIFIFWFKGGVPGAAVATLLAQVVGMVRVLLHFSDAASTVHFRRGIWQLRKTIVTGILSIGMAVDANILIFERFKEEIKAGKILRLAVQAGFKRAFTTIFDANMTVIITSAILFFLGSGTVKGFAFTLGLGVAVSMFTAITVSRTLLMLLIDASWIHNPWWFGGKRGYDR